MGAGFTAEPADGSVIAELSALVPTNPFATAGFFEARRQTGCAPWVLALRDDARGLQCGCGAFLRTGRLNRTLEIPSLPSVRAGSPFWDGLREFCAQHGITQLRLDTFASPHEVEIPALGAHCTRRSRCEFVLDLGGDPTAALSANHRRNIRRAQKAGLAVRRATSAEAAIQHQSLVGQSMDRRRSRGEPVRRIGPSLGDSALLQSGAGELFQAVRDSGALSSVLVLRAAKGGYYHSAGTSPEGMAVGASHFLLQSIGIQSRADGAELFNLGGADVESGLARFKQGFGASPVPLPSADCYVGPAWRRWASRGISLWSRRG